MKPKYNYGFAFVEVLILTAFMAIAIIAIDKAADSGRCPECGQHCE